jgi:3-oxosteroid 1-dehydrogenase
MKAGPLGSPKGTGSKFAAIAATHLWTEDNQEELAKGWFIKADTIQELGEMIECKDHFGRVVGMDAAGLVDTVNKYNQYCATGVDVDFGRNPSSLEPLATPPFYAMEICELQTNTQGGPEHNKDCQTLDPNGVPIPRLYNCGEFGSIFGALYSGGQNIPEAAAGGILAARHAVTLDPWDA